MKNISTDSMARELYNMDRCCAQLVCVPEYTYGVNITPRRFLCMHVHARSLLIYAKDASARGNIKEKIRLFAARQNNIHVVIHDQRNRAQ
jgi:hypothetical protein